MNGGDEQIDQMLSDHLRRRLDGQLGRASAAFDAAAAAGDGPSRRRLVLAIALTTGSIAAAIAFAWPLISTHVPSPQPPDVQRVVVTPPVRPDAQRALRQADEEPDLTRFLAWRAIDEGARVIDDTVPVRKLRYEAVEQIEWSEPVHDATIQLYVPVTQVLLVQQETF